MSNLEPRDLISAFIDGELSGEELRTFEADMASDPDLAEEVVSLRALVSELGDLPNLEVPAAVSAAVLARVGGLPIPGTEAATVQVAAEEGVGLITETGAAADIPKLALSALTGSGGVSGLLEGLLASLWFKVPVGAAVAALLALGMSHLIAPGTVGPPAAEFASTDAVRGDVPVAAAAASDDGVVALDVAADRTPYRETSPGEEADFGNSGPDPLMARPAARVRSGSASGPRARSRRSEKSVPDSAVGPEGVYEAEWETDAEQEVPVAEEEAPSPTGGDFKDAADSTTPAVYGRAADVTMDGEPLEDQLEPDADVALLEIQRRPVSGIASEQSKKESERVGYTGGAARSGGAADSAAMAPSPAPESAQESAPQAGNSLKVGSRAAANRLVQDLTAAPGVDVQITRHPTFFALALEVPVGDWDATLGTLRAAGSLDLSVGALRKGELQRVALDVLW